jgi:serine/threonine-protein phosphatase 6 regulatory ankyrin repeat subunit B
MANGKIKWRVWPLPIVLAAAGLASGIGSAAPAVVLDNKPPNVSMPANKSIEVKAAPQNFWEAVNAGSLPVVQRFARPADIDGFDALGQPALLLAAGRGYTDIAAWLLAQGANIEIRGPRQWTPLIAAAFGGHTDAVKLLLQHNADTKAQSDDGFYALFYAIDYRYDPVVAALVAAGAAADATTPAQVQSGHSALMRAVLRNTAAAALQLLNAGAPIEYRDTQQRTALFYAAEHNAIAALDVLSRWQVDYRARDNSGNTALQVAALKGQADTVLWLLEHGVDLNAKNSAGDTALQIAANAGNTEVALLLAGKSNKAAQHNALFAALQGGSLPTVSALVETGLPVDTRNNEGATPLMMAAQYSHAHLVEFLLQHNAAVGARDRFGNDALLSALLNPPVHGGIVLQLLKAGADKMQRNKRGQTAAELLAASDDPELRVLAANSQR